jgi:tetratricopeptide (TPR) repeat protein
MNRLYTLLVIAFLFIPSNVLGMNKFEKASQYFAFNMPADAEQIIQDAIKKDPFNPEVRFKIGKVYYDNNKVAQAKESLNLAIKADKKYASMVVTMYEVRGFDLLKNGKDRESLGPFEDAIKLGDNYRKRISNKIFHDAGKHIDNGNPDRASDYFAVLCSLDKSYHKIVSDIYYEMGVVSDFDGMNTFFDSSRKLSLHNDEKIVKHYLKLIDSKRLGKNRDKTLKNRIREIVGNAKYLNYFPVVWQQVGKTRTFEGKGVGGDNDEKYDVKTLSYGTDYNTGYLITLEGENAEAWYNGRWNKTEKGKFSFISKNSKNGQFIVVRAPKEEKFSIGAKKKM